MDGPDIGSTPDPNASIQYTPLNQPASSPTPAPEKVKYDQSASTMKESEAEALMALFLAMQAPGLVPPNMNLADFAELMSGKGAIDSITAKSIDLRFEETKNDIISSMWANFSKGIQELEERSKEDYIKKWVEEVGKEGPKSTSEYFAYLLVLSASRRADELGESGGQSPLAVQFNQSFNQWFTDPANTSAIDGRNGNFPDPAFIIGALASNPDALRAAIGSVGLVSGVEVSKQLSVSPIADALAGVGPSSGLPIDYQAAGALIAALLYQGAVSKANLETLQDAALKGKPPQDIEFAINYTKNILAIVTHNLKGGAEVSPEQQSQNQMIRLMLNVMALNLLYRRVFGGLEGGKEFTDLLKDGGTKDLLKDVAMDAGTKAEVQGLIDQLVLQIKINLPTDEPARSGTIARLSEYIDSNDSVDSMLSTTRMFTASLGATPDITQRRIGGTLI